MAIIKLQSNIERQKKLYYEFDSASEPLGEGGMGKVYKGKCVNEQTGMFREVAIKFMFTIYPNMRLNVPAAKHPSNYVTTIWWKC